MLSEKGRNTVGVSPPKAKPESGEVAKGGHAGGRGRREAVRKASITCQHTCCQCLRLPLEEESTGTAAASLPAGLLQICPLMPQPNFKSFPAQMTVVLVHAMLFHCIWYRRNVILPCVRTSVILHSVRVYSRRHWMTRDQSLLIRGEART